MTPFTLQMFGRLRWLTTPILTRGNRPPFWILVAVTASGTLAMHILVPVLPLVATDLAVSPAKVQLAITLYLVGIAGGQLIYGPISDKFGRRPVLLAAFFLYVIAGAVAGWATSISTLLMARIVQAMGGCGGLVLGRAIVRDSAASGEAASRMALLTTVQSLAPGLGPVIGGFLGAWCGWRAIFILLVGLGVVTLAGVVLALPETAAARRVSRPGTMFAGYLRLLRSPVYCGYMFGGAFTSTSFYAYLTASPFIFTHMLHRPAEEVGLYYLAVMAGVPVGSLVSSRLARTVRLSLLLRVTSAVAVLGAALFFLIALTDMLSVELVLGTMIVLSTGVGASAPLAITSAISTDPRVIGAASGLYGFVQMANGAVCTLFVGFFPDDPALAAASVLFGSLLLGQCFFVMATALRSASRG